jgi:hypothetical protein
MIGLFVFYSDFIASDDNVVILAVPRWPVKLLRWLVKLLYAAAAVSRRTDSGPPFSNTHFVQHSFSPQ